MILSKSSQEVTLAKGTYNSTEAKKLVCSAIKNRIKEAKLESMQMWVKNHNYDFNYCESVAEQLTQQEREIIELIERARFEGKKLEIATHISVRLSENSN